MRFETGRLHTTGLIYFLTAPCQVASGLSPLRDRNCLRGHHAAC